MVDTLIQPPRVSGCPLCCYLNEVGDQVGVVEVVRGADTQEDKGHHF